MISGTFNLKSSNSPAWDLFGQLEFGIESHTLPLSGEVIRYGITSAEVSFSILDGKSDRSSWFCDQLLGHPMEATVTDAHDSEVETTKSSGSKSGLSEKGVALEDSSGRSKKTKSVAKTEVQYKTNLINVRAVGTSEAPVWHFVPQPGSHFLAGYLPPVGTRLMQIVPHASAKPIELNVSAFLEYSLVSLSGAKAKANATIIAQAVWYKHFRSKKRTKTLGRLNSSEN